MVTPAAHREAAAYLQQTYEMSQRRACRVIDGDRASVRYQARRPDDGELRERLKALAQERRRFGYRRLHVLLRREGYAVNRKRVQRLYREERLMVRRRGGRKRALGTRRPLETPAAANQRWSLDFVSDQFTDGRRFRILDVYDDCTRECLALVADTSISGRRVARELDAIIARRGKPATIVSDNGTELTSNAILEWADQHKVGWHYIAPGKPQQASARASTASCATNCRTRPCSAPWRTPALSWRPGGGTSTRCTRVSATSRPPNTPTPSPERPAGALRTPTTPRAGLLPAATTKVQINPGLSLWLDEKWGQVTFGSEDTKRGERRQHGVDTLLRAPPRHAA